jgi:hypothetical protein
MAARISVKNTSFQDFPRLLGDVNQAGVQFIFNDLDLACTFLDVAAASTDDETARRNQENARKAYDGVVRFLKFLRLTPKERSAIDEMLGVLKTRMPPIVLRSGPVALQ